MNALNVIKEALGDVSPASFHSIPINCGVVGFALAIMFLNIQEVLLVIFGAIAYTLVSPGGSRKKSPKARPNKLSSYDEDVCTEDTFQQREQQQQHKHKHGRFPVKGDTKMLPPAIMPKRDVDYKTESVKPVLVPTFKSNSWDVQVQELLAQIEPTPENHRSVNRLVVIIQRVISKVTPDARVSGFTNANPHSAKAFAMAIPEVDIIIDVDLSAMAGASHDTSDPRMAKKAALRSFMGALLRNTGLKFRRSAFVSDEPKIIFSVPPSVGIADEAFGINIFVNAVTPLRSVALLDECAKLESHSKELVSLVRRWARDRAIAHDGKGHLPPYAWSLLTVYFLQVGVEEELLPPIHVKDGALKKKKRLTAKPNMTDTCTAALFKQFVNFYESFDWSKEIVGVSRGGRKDEPCKLPLPVVEDPFDIHSNVASCMTSAGLARMREEFSRAKDLCASHDSISLAEIIAPWAPPDQNAVVDSISDEHDESNNRGAESLPWRRPTSSGTASFPGQRTHASERSFRPGGSAPTPSAPSAAMPSGRVVNCTSPASLSGAPALSLRPGGGV